MSVTGSRAEKHLIYLDSARGIAALMVFFGHFICRNFQDQINVHYLLIPFNNNDAVSFFFVLSGFVLSYKYIVRNKELDIKKFYVSRVFRLFPAYFIIVFLSVLFAYRDTFGLEMLRDQFIFNKGEFWEEALLFRGHSRYFYPGWTLNIELLGSFLIPFYIALAIKNRRFVGYLIFLPLITGNNLYFSFHFLLGMLACCHYDYISGESFKATKWYRYRYLLIIAAMLLFSIRQIDYISPLGPSYKYLASYIGIDFFNYTGLSSFVFLVAILHSKKLQRFLQGRLLVFLGKISYSLYLVHVLIIETVYLFIDKYRTYPPDPLIFIGATLLCISLVIAIATLMHYYIELPFMRMGKRVIDRMKPSLRINAVEDRNADKEV